MPTLTEAEADLAKARDAHDKARIASEKATADAADLRAKVKSGQGAKITAPQIAEADQKAELAGLVHLGAAVDLPALSAAVQAARADEACDEVVAELPVLGRDVALALEAIEVVLAPLVAAVERYDSYAAQATHRLQTVVPHAEPLPPVASAPATWRAGGTVTGPFGPDAAPEPTVEVTPVASTRAKFPRHGVPTVDGVNLTSCRGPSQLAAIVCPVFEALGAHHALVENLKLLAAGAPQLPTP